MMKRLVMRLSALCLLLASVGSVAEVEPPDAHVGADQVMGVSFLVDDAATKDSSGVQHDDHCCHGHVMADPGIAPTAGPIGPQAIAESASVSAESVVFGPPTRPPKRPPSQPTA